MHKANFDPFLSRVAGLFDFIVYLRDEHIYTYTQGAPMVFLEAKVNFNLIILIRELNSRQLHHLPKVHVVI